MKTTENYLKITENCLGSMRITEKIQSGRDKASPPVFCAIRVLSKLSYSQTLKS